MNEIIPLQSFVIFVREINNGFNAGKGNKVILGNLFRFEKMITVSITLGLIALQVLLKLKDRITVKNCISN